MSKQNIVPIPQIPQEIIDAVNQGQLAIFFGAGTSMSIGCSSWNKLAETLINKCFPDEKKEDSPSTSRNIIERKTLNDIKDPKKIITICQCILDKNNSSDIFFETISDSLQPDLDLLDKQNIYAELYGLRGLFITTNIDTHFDERFDSSHIIYRKEDFTEDNIDKSKLYHIHGSILDWDSAVLTVKNYFDRYSDPKFMAFLRKIFDDKVILFIGYGLSEFEVLDFLFTKSEDSLPGRKKHFILLPYHQADDTKLEFDTYYYSELGIDVIPYLDKGDYKQLFNVIKTWNRDIILQSHVLSTLFNELKDAADNYDPSIEGNIFQEINNDRSCRLEFFKQLAQSQHSIPWLIPLKNRGYFDPKNNPAPINGYVPYWNIMGVLENIAKLNQTSPNSEITHEILTIIKSIIEYNDENNERILNILTDQHIIRIIFLLPLHEITQPHFDFIKKCMHDYTDTLYFAHDIVDTITPRLLENGNKELLLDILDIVLVFKRSEKPAFEEYISVLGDYHLNLVLERSSDKIITLCGIGAVKMALDKIEQIVREDPSQFNIIWVPSIKEYDEYADRYDNQVVHFVWIA
ncbi:MAG: SIR2 family protein, partial [Paludibacter sp.]|nr:SIR2 family protein [Paludibacter sp.]